MVITDTEKKVFDAMEEGVLIIDENGVILFGNRAYRRFLNQEAGGDIGDITISLRICVPGPCFRKW